MTSPPIPIYKWSDMEISLYDLPPEAFVRFLPQDSEVEDFEPNPDRPYRFTIYYKTKIGEE